MRKATSYYESVLALNQRLKQAGKAPVQIVELPAALEDEDVLEMLNAGLFEFVVVDDWKARMWAQVLPKIKVREDLVAARRGLHGLGGAQGQPEADRGDRRTSTRTSSRSRACVENRVWRSTTSASSRSSNNTAGRGAGSASRRRSKLFEKYGAQYGFDPLMLAAQGYQESQLNQDARSHVGAIGVMQIMPATGEGAEVGDIRQIEPNIQAAPSTWTS